MSALNQPTHDLLSLAAERRVDAVCQRFEAAWKSGTRPDLGNFLSSSTGAERSALLRELVLLDLEYRRHVGETPRPEEYLGQFPDSDDALSDLFAPQPTESGVGAVIGERFTLVEKIGEGGMGTVYRARDAALTREVAVKFLRNRFPADSPMAGRFLEEVRITAQLQHPTVPAVHEVGKLPDARPFLVMKLIRGQTLAQLIAAGRTERGELVAAFEQVCQAVAYAHSRGVVHRDLKPSNVMVGAFGEVQLMDWGLAKFRDPHRTEPTDAAETFHDPRTDAVTDPDTRAGSFLGTPAYMAPEQAIGAVDLIDERSDVFGLGGILCAILTGQPPFVAGTGEGARQLSAQMKIEPALARLDASGTEPALVGLCKACLAREPADRPQSGKAVADEVLAIRTELEHRARRAELEKVRAEGERQKAELRVREQRKRQRVLLALAGAVMMLLLGVGAFLWYSDRQSERQKAAEAEQARIQTEAEANEAVLRAKGAQKEAEANAAQLKAQVAQAEKERLASDARNGVHTNLKRATDFRKQYRFADAGAALAQAEELAKGAAPDLLPSVDRTRHDLAFVATLDHIRFRKWVWTSYEGGRGSFDRKFAPVAYRKEFAARGLDLTALTPAEAAKLLAASAIKNDLVAAVDDWAIYEPDQNLRARLLEVARHADPGEWTNRLRDPNVQSRPAELERLAAAALAAGAPPAALSLLAELMSRQGLSPVRLLSAARVEHPTDFELAFALARWYTDFGRAGEPGAEIAPYEAARALRPDVYAVWNNLGIALYHKGDIAGAITLHERAIALSEKLAPAHNSLGNDLIKRGGPGDLDRAIAEYIRAIALDPDFAITHYNLGNALYAKGLFTRAVAEHTRAIELDPDYAPAHCGQGMALYRNGDLNRAIAAHTRAIKLDPTFAAAHGNLGNVLNARRGPGDLDAAITAFGKVIELEPKNAVARYNLGNALSNRNDRAGAIRSYKEAIALDPKLALAHYQLGLALKADGNLDGAVTAYRSALEVAPNHAPTHYNLGIALKLKRDVDGAMKAYQEAVRLDPKHARAHTNLGAIYFEQEKFAAAAAAARAAVKAEPALANAHALLGRSLLQLGDTAGARAALTEAARIDERFAPDLRALPPVPVAPPPRELKR
jgi:tetratricopeptide (TPR) repeat protein